MARFASLRVTGEPSIHIIQSAASRQCHDKQNIQPALIGIKHSFAKIGCRVSGFYNMSRAFSDKLKGVDRTVLGAHHGQVLDVPLLQLLHRIFRGLKRVFRRALHFNSRMCSRRRREEVDRKVPNDFTQQDVANGQRVRPTSELV